MMLPQAEVLTSMLLSIRLLHSWTLPTCPSRSRGTWPPGLSDPSLLLLAWASGWPLMYILPRLGMCSMQSTWTACQASAPGQQHPPHLLQVLAQLTPGPVCAEVRGDILSQLPALVVVTGVVYAVKAIRGTHSDIPAAIVQVRDVA